MAQILVVDDTELIRVMIRDLLEEAGHTVTEAGNGADGLQSFHALRPDLVVTDLVMPGMGGAGLIEAIRRECPQARILAVSGRPSVVERSPSLSSLDHGVRTLRKPFRHGEFLSAVDDLLASDRRSS